MSGSLVSVGCDFLTCPDYPYDKLGAVRMAFSIYSKGMSMRLLAESFNIDIRTAVKLLRWKQGKLYSRPIPSLVDEVYNEVLADFIKE